MSGIQRWDTYSDGMGPARDGMFVLFSDHVAAVAKIADAQQAAFQSISEDRFAAGVKAARDAVEAVPVVIREEERGDLYGRSYPEQVSFVRRKEALAAIDALEKP